MKLVRRPLRRPTLMSWIAIMALGLIGGGTFFGIEIALRGMEPMWIAAFRIIIAASILAAIWLAQGVQLFTRRIYAHDAIQIFLISMLSTVVPFTLISWGQKFVSSGFAAISMAFTALLVLPLSHFLVPGEQLDVRKAAGFVVGFGGAFVIIGPGILSTHSISGEQLGQVACFLAALCYAFSSILVWRLDTVNPVGLAALVMLLGSLVAVPVAWIKHGLPTEITTSSITALVFLAVFSTVIANLLGIRVVRSAGPAFMGLTNYLTPLFAVVLGSAILGERVSWSMLFGLLLILGGITISYWKKS